MDTTTTTATQKPVFLSNDPSEDKRYSEPVTKGQKVKVRETGEFVPSGLRGQVVTVFSCRKADPVPPELQYVTVADAEGNRHMLLRGQVSSRSRKLGNG
jgi:hypothetical protein